MDPWLRFIAFVLLLLVSITSASHRARADRVGGRVKHPAFHGWRGSLLIPVRLLLVALLAACFLDPPWIRWSHMHLPDAARWAGVGVAGVGVILVHWMFRHLGLNVTPVPDPRADATLVTTGPYRSIRHPLYTFATLCLVGIAVAVDSWLLLAFPIGAFVVMAIRVPREERLLTEKFGDAYRQYMASTGRFLPKRAR